MFYPRATQHFTDYSSFTIPTHTIWIVTLLCVNTIRDEVEYFTATAEEFAYFQMAQNEIEIKFQRFTKI